MRFIHEARNDAEKGRLFAAARAGDVAVLIGSTQKMGVGVNVQARCVALHHIDCPWRPADIEQRDGRALRQGNQNDEIGNYRYVVEGSFDAYSWQTVERKAGFIAQIMRGRLDVREIDDIGDSALSFAEVKALASGDPLILEKAEVDAERTRLERLQRAHQRNQHALARTVAGAEGRFDQAARELPAIAAAIAAARDTRGDAFEMTIGDRRTTARPEAARLIQEWIASHSPGGIPYGRAELAARRARRARRPARRRDARQAVRRRRPRRRADDPRRARATREARPGPRPRRRAVTRPPARAPHRRPPRPATAHRGRRRQSRRRGRPRPTCPRPAVQARRRAAGRHDAIRGDRQAHAGTPADDAGHGGRG